MADTREDRRCCAQRRRAVPPPVAAAHRDSPPMPPVQFPPPPTSSSHPQLTVCADPPFALSLAADGSMVVEQASTNPGGNQILGTRGPHASRSHLCAPALPRDFSTPPSTSRKPPLSCSVPPTLTRCRSRCRRFGARFKVDSTVDAPGTAGAGGRGANDKVKDSSNLPPFPPQLPACCSELCGRVCS